MSQETSAEPQVSAEEQLEAVFAKRYGEESPADDEPDVAAAEEAEAAEETEDDRADGDADDDGAASEPAEAKAKTADDELVEEEIDGEVFKLPKKVHEAVLRQKDYTQKTQEVASIRKIAEDRANYYEAANGLMQQAFQEAAQVHAIGQQLQQLNQVDWNKAIAEDPQRAMQLSLQRQQLSEAYQRGQAYLQTAAQKHQEIRSQHESQQLELGHKELLRRGVSIDAKTREQMLGMASELGYDSRDLMSHAAIHALQMAAKYKALQDSKPGVVKKVSQAKPYQAPAARSTQTTSAATKLSQLKTAAKKTGSTRDVEAFLEARFSRNR